MNAIQLGLRLYVTTVDQMSHLIIKPVFLLDYSFSGRGEGIPGNPVVRTQHLILGLCSGG